MLSQLLVLSGVTLMAGLAMPLGALIARIGRGGWQPSAEFSHTIMAFGGGALLSAVALVLVPEGSASLSMPVAATCLVLGGLVFMLIDIGLSRSATPADQMLAMLLDFVPESLALGAAFALGSQSAYLIAALIALQNIPEGYNAFRELSEASGYGARRILLMFSLMAFLGPLAAMGGYFWFSDHDQALGIIVLVAAGGILYSVFQDIAPKVPLARHWSPPMGAVLGFMLGMAGDMLVH
ncbi:MAG: hypothetical protein KDI28_07895 [Pseudomonadales bacterium]|nr:hypothetical protein [Pseudomonadales bacterium]